MHQITFGQEMSKKGGVYTDRITVLPLDSLTRVIENVYTSEKVRILEYNRHILVMLVVFRRPHTFLQTRAKDVDGDDDAEIGNGLDSGKEPLRPLAIAQMPQIFWSIVSHCRPCLELDPNIEGYYLSMEDMLRQLLPNLDWSYLNRDGQKQLLSKQAKENICQAKKNCDDWLLVTPTEYDEDEL